MTGKRGSIQERLWRRVDRRGPDECWPWLGFRDKSGHGRINAGVGRSPGFAHRVAWESTNGPIPEGLIIRHACDNPPCCNPSHLLVGTKKDNTRDALERGQFPMEFRKPNTRISDPEVLFIRSAYRVDRRTRKSNADVLAAMFGVQASHIGRIARGERRQHVSTARLREVIGEVSA